MSTHTLTTVTDENFASDILEQPGLTVAKFSADWCGPCHMLTPIFESLAQSRCGTARFVDVDADASPRASVRFGVRGIPTILFFRDGSEVGRIVGAVPKQRIESELDRLASA